MMGLELDKEGRLEDFKPINKIADAAAKVLLESYNPETPMEWGYLGSMLTSTIRYRLSFKAIEQRIAGREKDE